MQPHIISSVSYEVDHDLSRNFFWLIGKSVLSKKDIHKNF